MQSIPCLPCLQETDHYCFPYSRYNKQENVKEKKTKKIKKGEKTNTLIIVDQEKLAIKIVYHQ
jgi:phage terminase large subunit